MLVELKPVAKAQKEILRNLLEKYLYEFSQYDGQTMNGMGLMGYDWLDCYWTERDRWAFFILADGRLAGFAMVNSHVEARGDGDFSMAEFFVAYPYRRQGVGREAAKQVFALLKGKWELMYHPKNQASAAFWQKVCQAYGKNCSQGMEISGLAYGDGTLGRFLFFDT